MDKFISLPPNQLDPHAGRCVHVSAIYKANDPQLVTALIHLLHKMLHVPQERRPLPLVCDAYQYPLLDERGWHWQSFAPSASLSYTPRGIDGSESHLILLQAYQGGSDGAVWLASSPEGRLVVLKFPRRTSYASTFEIESLLQKECEA